MPVPNNETSNIKQRECVDVTGEGETVKSARRSGTFYIRTRLTERNSFAHLCDKPALETQLE